MMDSFRVGTQSRLAEPSFIFAGFSAISGFPVCVADSDLHALGVEASLPRRRFIPADNRFPDVTDGSPRDSLTAIDGLATKAAKPMRRFGNALRKFVRLLAL